MMYFVKFSVELDISIIASEGFVDLVRLLF